MTLKSALQDLRETTLATVSGLLAKLAYLTSLRRREGGYVHWGLSRVHGPESSQRALKAAHAEALAEVLRTPLPALMNDLHESSESDGINASAYADELRGRLNDLLPEERKDSPAAIHLNSVLLALSTLEKTQERATRSTS